MTRAPLFKTLVSALMVSGLLTACGGGGGGTSGSGSTAAGGSGGSGATAAAVTGAVADGYLVGAKVCLDKNANGACDTGEPFAITTAGGKYSIDGVTAEDARLYAVVAEVPANAVDEDTGQQVGGGGYVLAAPAGKPDFISPLSTLVHKEVKEGAGLSTEEAETKVKAKLGLTEDASLLQDYVKHEDSNAVYKDLHKVAQVLATVIKEERSNIQDLAASAGVSEEKATQVILDKVMDRLAPVLEAVKAGDTVQGAVSTAGLTRSNLTGAVTKDDVKQEVERKDLLAKAETGNPLDAWKQPMYWLDIWLNTVSNVVQPVFDIGQLISPDGKSLTEKTFKRTGSGDWTADKSGETNPVLTASGWKLVNDGVESLQIVVEGDHLNVTNTESGEAMVVRTAAIDLTGKPVRETLAKLSRDSEVREKLLKKLPEAPSFSTGAKGQLLQFVRSNDQYQLWGNDSSIWVKGKVATTLDELLTDATALTADNAIGYSSGGLAVVLSSDGKAYFARMNWSTTNSSERIAERLGTGTWERKTVNGQELILVPLSGDRRVESDRQGLVFAVYDGKVRGGSFRAKGSVNQEIQYNASALQDVAATIKSVLAYFDLPTF